MAARIVDHAAASKAIELRGERNRLWLRSFSPRAVRLGKPDLLSSSQAEADDADENQKDEEQS
jgi:hypothetical protein